ncbi:hypothetical protein QLH52_24520, partial [Methylomonas sp. OY6]
RPKAEVRVFTLNVGLKFKSAIQIIKVVGWISEAPSTYLRSYGGWRFAYPPYGPIWFFAACSVCCCWRATG